MVDLLPAVFCGDTIYLVEIDGEPFAPMRQICEAIGVSWPSQEAALASTRRRLGCKFALASETTGDKEKMLCIPVRKLSAWLASINADTTNSEVRDKIARYQNECDDFLWRFWKLAALTTAARYGGLSEPTPQRALADGARLDVARAQLETAAGILCGLEFAFDTQTRVDMLFAADAQCRSAMMIIASKYSEVLGYAA